jgi:hypothetical protein
LPINRLQGFAGYIRLQGLSLSKEVINKSGVLQWISWCRMAWQNSKPSKLGISTSAILPLEKAVKALFDGF